jgi:hypothetical protein
LIYAALRAAAAVTRTVAVVSSGGGVLKALGPPLLCYETFTPTFIARYCVVKYNPRGGFSKKDRIIGRVAIVFKGIVVYLKLLATSS